MAKKSSKKVISKKANVTKIKENSSKISKISKDSKFNLNLNMLKKFIPVILILIVMFVAFSIRSGPIDLNGLDVNIKANTMGQIQNLISQEINTKYPNLADNYKQELVAKEYKKVVDSGVLEISGQKINIDDVVKQNAEQIKSSFKADNGQTYLNAIDPYHFLRLSELYYKNGYAGDKIVDGKPIVSYKLAPNGVAAAKNPEFHIVLESFMFKLNGLTDSSSLGDKIRAVYLLPVFFVMLLVIPLFLIIRRFADDLSALFGSLVLVTIGTFVSRTVAGFVDTDAYNVFFPLLIVAFLIYGFVYRNLYLTILFGVLAGFSQGLFIWAWSNGWFIFIFTLFALLGYLGYIIILNIISKINFKEFTNIIKNDLFLLISFVLSSYLFTYLMTSINIFKSSYDGLLGSVSTIASVSQTNIWPNVLSSVAELNPASFAQIVQSVGGKIIFIIAMVGIVFLILDLISKNTQFNKFKKGLILFSIVWFVAIISGNFLISLTVNSSLLFLALLFLPIGIALILSLINKNKSDKIFISILLSIWIGGTIYMSLNGVRFILLLAPAFAISFGIGMFYIFKIINKFFVREFNIKNNFKKLIGGFIIVSILFLTLYSPMFTQAKAISNGTVPNFDDAWYSSMAKIKNSSSSDAIITSWWDFGHFFTAVAQRGVTFDGASQTTPQAHWVGKLLMENDQDKSRDILRMLVCGGNYAFETMLSFTNGTSADAVKINKIIYLTFGKNILETRKILENNKYYNYSSDEIDKIMSYLACSNPVEDFVITSEDMVGKAGVWAHWGSWDFTKKYVFDNYNSLSAKEISLNIDENVSLIESYITQLKAIDVQSKTQNIKKENLINQWFAPYPSYIPIQGKYRFPCNNLNGTLSCQNGIQINMTSLDIKSQFGSQVVFKNLIFPTNLGNLKIVEKNPKGNVDALLIPSSNGNFEIMIMQSPLGASLFTKLFYLNGFGANYFEKFDSTQSATGVKIKVWKVNWSENISSNSIIKSKNNLIVKSVEFQ